MNGANVHASHAVLNVGDFMPSNAQISCVAGQWNKLGEYVVKAGEGIVLGYGLQSGQHDAQGRLYMDIKDDSNPATLEPGLVRFVLETALDIPIKVLGEYDTAALSVSTDRTKQIPFPMMLDGATEDKKICIYFKPLSSDTVVAANCEFKIDATRYYTK